MKAIKSNMKDQILTGDRKILHCPECDAEFSGNAGDYFMHPDDYIFYCINLGCGAEMELVTKVVTVKHK